MITHKQLLEICLFDNSTDSLHLHLHTLHIETVTHSSYKDYVFSLIFQDFVLSNSAYLLIF